MPVPTSEEPFQFFRHSEIFHISRQAVPPDHMTLQGVFEGASVAEVHPRHEVREGRWIGDGQIDDGMIRGRRKQSREPRCHACRDRELPARDLGCQCGLGSGVDQVERRSPTEEGPQESGLCREVVDVKLYCFVVISMRKDGQQRECEPS